MTQYLFPGNTIPLRTDNGAYSNPLYKNSAIGDDLYDRPRSYKDDGGETTVQIPSKDSRYGEFHYVPYNHPKLWHMKIRP